MRSLVTGGRGFVGSWLDRAPARSGRRGGAPSTTRSRSPTRTRSLAAVRRGRARRVYHLAALTHVGQSWDEPLRGARVNAIGHAALLEAARACGTDPRVLVTSSAEVYGAGHRSRPSSGHRGITARPRHPVRGEQGGRRVPRRPGVSGHGLPVIARASLQPRRARARRRPSWCPRWPSASSTPTAAAHARSRRQPDGPAGPHRRARRGAGLPAARRAGAGGRGLQRLLGPRRRHRRDRATAHRAGRVAPRVRDRPGAGSRQSTCRWCAATPPSCTRRPVGNPRSRSNRPWPT